MADKTFLVTGGNGYIGSHMCKFLCESGHEVYIVDDYSTSPKRPTHQYGHFYNFRLSDPKTYELLKSVRFDAVFHFAAKALVEESQTFPMKYYQANVVEGLSFVKSLLKANIRKLIFSSTCATFGKPGAEKIGEGDNQNPINTYGQSKRIMELILRDLAEKQMLNVGVLRYFNVAGCDPKGELGEQHDPETHLIPNLCKSLLNSQKWTFKIHGEDYPTPDGTCIRDFIHVEDLVRGHWSCYEYLLEHTGFCDFNLGSGKGYSVKEVLETFQKVSQKKLRYEVGTRREGDPERLVAKTDKAQKELAFKPQYNLEDCIEHTLNYFKKNIK